MQLQTASSISSSVSAQDVPAPSASSNKSFGQYSSIRGEPVVSFIEPAMAPVAMAKVFITATENQKAAQESDLVEQSLMRWCSAGRRIKEG